MQLTYTTLKEMWVSFFRIKAYRIKFLFFFLLLLLTVLMLPRFFHYIEMREGIVLNDYLLSRLPAYNVSLLLFALIWSVIGLALWQCIWNPKQCLLLLIAFTLLTLLRVACLYFVELNAPPGLIVLQDPLSNFFYGTHFITKDLFFSGHTATMFLMYLWFQKRSKKIFALACTCIVGILLLVQHIHYSVDIVAAPVFTYLTFKLAKKIY
ncbi:MAG: phosphatase PAP2-related protein [Ferruginibacter sp.]